ncbi:MAG: RNA polymerase sigma factor [Bacteroidales bacterium]|nr:RNA polymerase sigma factor [Bacteroidales bacterium]
MKIKKKKKLETITDNELMQEIQAGDVEKLGLLFERYKRMLFGFFYRVIGNKEVSEDLVQNVFIRILRFKNQFRGEGKFTTWMYRIARNEIADYFKKEKKFGYKEDISDLSEKIDGDPLAEQKSLKEDQLQLLNYALQKLSVENRELIIMNRYQGLKYKEIGEMLDVSEGAVKVRTFRAMNELKKNYSKLEAKTL